VIIEDLKVLIGEGKLEKVLDILSSKFNLKDENEKTLILNKSRFAKIERKKLNNVSTDEDEIQRNKIEENILHLLDEIEPSEMLKETTLPEKQDNQDCSDPSNKRRPKKKWPVFKSSMSGNGCMISVAFTILLISFLSSCLLSFLNINLKSFKSIFDLKPETSFHKTTSSVDQLTIFITDAIGNVVLEFEGELNIPIGNKILNRPDESDSRTNFGDIIANKIGDSITIDLKIEGWEIDGPNTFLFEGKPINLIVKRENNLGMD